MKITISTFICLLLIAFQTQAQNDCQYYGHSIRSTGFSCENTIGEICFTTTGDITSGTIECFEYLVEIEFTTGDFIYTNLGQDFTVFQEDITGSTILRGQPLLNPDYVSTICLEGVVQTPNTQFQYRIIHPVTGHIVESGSFTVDDFNQIGNNSSSMTTLSQAIASGVLLPASQAPSAGQNIIINGELIIDVNYEMGMPFSNFSNIIQMGPDASIRVNPNITLDLTNTNIFGCDQKWDRIILEDNSLLILNRCNVSDGEVAVELLDNSRCTVVGSVFSDNSTAFGSYGPNKKDVDLNILSTPFVQNTIKDGGHGINFENVEFLNIVGHTNFLNLNRAIQLQNTDLNAGLLQIRNNDFGINSYGTTTSTNISDCSFDYNIFAIHVKGALVSFIEDNTMFNNRVGILRESAVIEEYTKIFDNTIKGSEMAIAGNITTSRGEIRKNDLANNNRNISLNGLFGTHIWATYFNEHLDANDPTLPNIRYNNTNFARLSNNPLSVSQADFAQILGGNLNIVAFNRALAIGSDAKTINLQASPTSTIACNELTSSDIALHVVNDNAGSDIRGNTMISTGSGYNLTYGAPTMTFANTGPQEFKGNKFDASTANNPVARNYSIAPIASTNYYRLGYNSGNQGSTLFPYFSANTNNWFNVSLTDNNDDGCGGTVIPDLSPSSLEQTILTNSNLLNTNIGQNYNNDKVFEVEYNLAYAIAQYTDLYGAAMLSYLNQISQQEAIGLANAVYTLNSTMASSVSESSQDTKFSQISSNVTSINNYFDNIYASNNKNIDPSIITDPQYTSLVSTFNTIKQINTASILQDNQNYIQSLSAIKQQVGSITSQVDAANYLAESIVLTIEYLENGNKLDNIRKARVKTLADMCGYDYPRSVYQSRALYDMISDAPQIYTDNCQRSQTRSIADDEIENVALLVYPNPASNTITISTQRDLSKPLSIDIINIEGKSVQSVILKESTQVVDISNLPNGIYSLLSEDTLLNDVRFVKIQ